MSALPNSREHRVTALARRCREELGAVAEAPLWSLNAAEAGDTLVLLTQARSQLDELLARLLRHAETVETGHDTGATSTTNWWAHATRTTRGEAHRTARLAASLERYDTVRAALVAGDLRTDQARVIVDAVDALPDDVEDWVPAAATEFLLGRAGEHDAKALRVLGRRLLEVIDPVAADKEEARRLAREEAHARAIASFTMTDDGTGTCHGRFTIPSLHGAMLLKNLKARAAASRPDPDRRDGRLSRHALGLAFMDYIETRPDDTTPTAGGVAATVVVTMELESLLGGLKAASLDTGGRISAGEARRLACRAGIIPMVLGGPSVVLDAGRKRRFHSETQRIAMGVRDKGCTAAGCDAPPAFCHAHHDETPGHTAAAPASPRAACSAHATTPSSTTQPSSTPSTSTAKSDSPDGPRTGRTDPVRHHDDMGTDGMGTDGMGTDGMGTGGMGTDGTGTGGTGTGGTGTAGIGRLVSLALDPVLVPAGFQGAQYGDDGAGGGGGDVQIIFCAGHEDFSRRHPQLPQANQQQHVGTCVDLVMDIGADGTLGRLDLEGTSVAETLRNSDLVEDGQAVAQLTGRAVVESLPVLKAALGRLFGGTD